MEKLTIIIAVYNAAEKLQACLDSILAHTSLSDARNLLLIDDAGGEPALEAIYKSISSPYIQLVRNPQNIGYTKSVNRAISLCPARDVILLNSDTMVSPGWLDKLQAHAHSDPAIGTVTPVSNNAGEFSVPKANENPIPPGLSHEDIARIVEACGRGKTFDVPTGNGFCLYIRARLIEGIGLFDEINFPRGYGEENDFCMRAYYAGFRNIVALDTWIWHAGHSSFGNSRAALELAGLEKLRALYPDYFSLVRKFQTDSTLLQVRAAIGRRIDAASRQTQASKAARADRPARPEPQISGAGGRIYSVIREYARQHGLARTARKIARNAWQLARSGNFGAKLDKLDSMYKAMNQQPPAPQTLQAPPVLDFDIPDKKTIQDLLAGTSGLVCLVDHNWGGGANIYARCRTDAWLRDGQAVLRLAHPPEQPFVYATFHAPRGRLVYRLENPAQILDLDWLPFSEIFINELVLWDGPDNGENACKAIAAVTEKLCALARVRQIPMKMPVHDFFCVCPSFNLVGRKGVYCGLPAESACGECLGNPDFDIGEWRAAFRRLLENLSEIICFSAPSADMIRKIYPEAAEKIRLVPHKPLVSWPKRFVPPPGGPMRVAVIGNINVTKGLDIVKELHGLLARDEQLIVLGGCEGFAPDSEKVVFHGAYQREELPALLERYGVTVALVPSVWPETFCYVVQECMGLGLPLVCFGLGAQAERVRNYDRGLLASEITAASAYQALRELDARRSQ